MAACAYCGLEGTLTREHIVPAFMYEFQKQMEGRIEGWNEVAQKMVGGELKIKDVCGDCNNGVLSELDSAGKALLQEAGVMTHNYTRSQILLKYDFDLLLRWLLKISFNSSRTDSVHSPLFEPYVPYMLGKHAAPARSEVGIVAYMAAGIELSDEKRRKLPRMNELAGRNKLNPFLMRICYGAAAGGAGYVLRMVIFGPLVFFLLMFEGSTLPGFAAAEIRRFVKLSPGAIELDRRRKVVNLSEGKRTWLDLFEDQVARVNAISV